MEKLDKILQDFGELVSTTVEHTVSKFSGVPGFAILLRYIRSSYQNDPIRSLLELLLLLFAIRYFLASKYSTTKKNYVHLEDWEVDELVDEWEPEPLVGPLTAIEKKTLLNIPVIKGQNGPKVHLTSYDEIFTGRNQNEKIQMALLQHSSSGNSAEALRLLRDQKEYLNFTTTDIFNLGNKPAIKEEAVKIIRSYGVGSCGPAGFYGNQDAHVNCEKNISKFLGAESAILYSQGFATPSSVIPCFFKRGDCVVVDENVNISIQKGIVLSRAHVYFYKHNDMVDLENKVAQALKSHRKGPLPRRIIVTEGIFEYSGDSPDLKKIVEIKKKYKFRLLLDESLSLGVLGATGRGLPEECGVSRKDVDVTLGTLANAFGSAGGFCAGFKYMVDYQQITSLAYTFSATMPPYLANTTSTVINKYFDTEEHQKTALVSVHKKASLFVDQLTQYPGFTQFAKIISRNGSPYIIIHILDKYIKAGVEKEVAQAVEYDEKGSIGEDSKTAIAAVEAVAAVAAVAVRNKRTKFGIEELETEERAAILQKIIEEAKSNGILVSRQSVLGRFNKFKVEQGLRVLVNNGLSENEVIQGAMVLGDAVVKIVSQGL